MTILKIVGVILGTLVLRTLLKHYDLSVLGIMTYYIWFLLGILVAKKKICFTSMINSILLVFVFLPLENFPNTNWGGYRERRFFI